jgi:16S rRNA (guanine1207-N2)-methyltransferase
MKQHAAAEDSGTLHISFLGLIPTAKKTTMENKIPVKLPFGKTIFQTSSGQSITSDTAFMVETMLHHFKTERLSVLELGSGNGIISIMLSYYRPTWKITGIDIQPHLVKLAKDNSRLAEVDPLFLCSDLKSFSAKKKIDLIISNPPYFPKIDGRISPVRERAISRHEIKCTMNDVLNAVKRNLNSEGKAYLLYPMSRINELWVSAKRVDLKFKEKIIFFETENKKKVLVVLKHA